MIFVAAFQCIFNAPGELEGGPEVGGGYVCKVTSKNLKKDVILGNTGACRRKFFFLF